MQKNNLYPCRMTSSKGFYKWAWGIIEGCCNECDYCYARKKGFNELKFYEHLIDEPRKIDPSLIFVNHLGDIMCYDPMIVNRIIDVCRDLPGHEFLFMTKLPGVYAVYDFPGNCILGVTIESQDNWYRAEIMRRYERTMCSVEPILSDFTGKDFSHFEFVVVGCLIGETDHSFYESVKHTKIFYTR